jgi:hypothetical protein
LSVKQHILEEVPFESGFWNRQEYCKYRNIPLSQERRERAEGRCPPFIIADRNGRILYKVGPAKEYAENLPSFGSRAEAYASYPQLAERDAKQSENMEQTRKQRWTAETRARHAGKPRRRAGETAAIAGGS